MRSSSSGFTILDLVACIGLAAVVSAVGVPAVRSAATDNALQRCRYNMRTIAQGGAIYQEDFAGSMWALNLKGGMKSPIFPGLTTGSDLEAQAHQAVDIMRRRAGLTPDWAPVPGNWVAPFSFSHLPLVDYLGLSLPSSTFVCPLDARRAAYVNGDYRQYPQSLDGATSIWMVFYTTSYAPTVYQWSPSRQSSVPGPNGTTLTPMVFPPASDADTLQFDPGFSFGTGSFGARRASDVAFPSQKVAVADMYARHGSTQRYFAYSDAVQDLQFYDGSVRRYRTDHTNPGWNPTSLTTRRNMNARIVLKKFPNFWGGLDNNATSATFAAGWYRWTRGGLLGWDVPRFASMIGKPPSTSLPENELDTRTGQW